MSHPAPLPGTKEGDTMPRSQTTLQRFFSAPPVPAPDSAAASAPANAGAGAAASVAPGVRRAQQLSMTNFVASRTARVGVIGSRDSPHFSALVFERMCERTLRQIEEWGFDPRDTELVSGGCTWGDHVAVYLALNERVARAAIHLPCGYARVTNASGVNTIELQGIKGELFSRMLRDLHRSFSESRRLPRGRDSLCEMRLAMDAGRLSLYAHATADERNAKIAAGVQHLIAFVEVKDPHTRAPPAHLGMGGRNGGTYMTWSRAGERKHRVCFDLADLGVALPDTVTQGMLADADSAPAGMAGMHYVPGGRE